MGDSGSDSSDSDHSDGDNASVVNNDSDSSDVSASTHSNSDSDSLNDEPSSRSSPANSVFATQSRPRPRIMLSRLTTTTELAIYRRTTALSCAVILLALLSCSASQLRMQLVYPHAHSYALFVYCLIGTCIAMEILSAGMYIFLSRYDFPEHLAEHAYTALIFCLLIIVVTSLFITSFTTDDSICKMMKLDKYKLLRRHRRLLAARGLLPNTSRFLPRSTISPNPYFNRTLG